MYLSVMVCTVRIGMYCSVLVCIWYYQHAFARYMRKDAARSNAYNTFQYIPYQTVHTNPNDTNTYKHIHINTHQFKYIHIHAIHTNTFNTYQYNVIHINTQYILIHAIHTNTGNKYQYALYMPIPTIHTDTHQYTPTQIQTYICNTYQYMQILANT